MSNLRPCGTGLLTASMDDDRKVNVMFLSDGEAYNGGRIQLLHPNDTANVPFLDGHTATITGKAGANNFPINYHFYYNRDERAVQY